MAEKDRQVVPGLTAADLKSMTDEVFNRTDGNHPQISDSENGFLDIIQNGKPDLSSSPAFVRKITL
jgi:hypothetical protein